jgi:hypothetical protein
MAFTLQEFLVAMRDKAVALGGNVIGYRVYSIDGLNHPYYGADIARADIRARNPAEAYLMVRDFILEHSHNFNRQPIDISTDDLDNCFRECENDPDATACVEWILNDFQHNDNLWLQPSKEPYRFA